MIRPACPCVLALVSIALIGFERTTAGAEQSEPAAPAGQANPKPAANAPQQPGAATQLDTRPNPNPASAPQNSGASTPSTPSTSSTAPRPSSAQAVQPTQTFTSQQGEKQTPAQQQYGLPRNPIFGGSVDIDLSQPLTLERAIRIGLQRQNQIAIAQTQVEESSARLVQARSTYYPQITPSLQYQTNLSPGGRVFIGGQTFRGASATETRTDLITARQLIFDTGKREATVGLNRRTLFASQYGVGNQRQTVVLSVTIAYYTLLRDKELVRVQEESVHRAQTTLEAIRAQVAAGAAAKTDTFQAESDLANAQVALLQTQNDYGLAQASLKNAMGVVTSQPVMLAQDRVPTPNTLPDPVNLDGYVRLAYQNRLDVKQQQERVNAQGYNVRIAQINSGLSVDATITEGYALDPDAGEERTFLVSFTYPLFDGGNTRAAVRENKAALETERRNLDQLQQNIRLNVEQSYVQRELARRRVVAAQVAVQAGQTNYDAALEKQKNGVINILDVINAEVQLVNAQVAEVQAVYDFYIADAQIKRETGVNDPVYVPNVPGARLPRLTPGP